MIGYTIQTKEKCLKIEAKTNTWDIVAYSDSDFAGDKDDRKIITGYVIFVSGSAISWKSKSQPYVTLSSTETKYVALNETVREVKFIFQLLKKWELKQKNQRRYMLIMWEVFFSQRTKQVEREQNTSISNTILSGSKYKMV
jgi:hypothetical protein